MSPCRGFHWGYLEKHRSAGLSGTPRLNPSDASSCCPRSGMGPQRWRCHLLPCLCAPCCKPLQRWCPLPKAPEHLRIPTWSPSLALIRNGGFTVEISMEIPRRTRTRGSIQPHGPPRMKGRDHGDVRTRVFTAAQAVTAKSGKQPRCPSASERIRRCGSSTQGSTSPCAEG